MSLETSIDNLAAAMLTLAAAIQGMAQGGIEPKPVQAPEASDAWSPGKQPQGDVGPSLAESMVLDAKRRREDGKQPKGQVDAFPDEEKPTPKKGPGRPAGSGKPRRQPEEITRVNVDDEIEPARAHVPAADREQVEDDGTGEGDEATGSQLLSEVDPAGYDQLSALVLRLANAEGSPKGAFAIFKAHGLRDGTQTTMELFPKLMAAFKKALRARAAAADAA